MSKKILMIVAVIFVLAVSSVFAQGYGRNGGGRGGRGACGGTRQYNGTGSSGCGYAGCLYY